MNKIIYYSDPLHDDFAGTNIHTKQLNPKYQYIHTGLCWRIAGFFLYNIFARPLVFLFTKLAFRQKVVNRDALKKSGKSGMYLYANHTNMLLDAYCPNIIYLRKTNYIIVGPDIMSIPGMNTILEMFGSIPIGSTIKQKAQMQSCVFSRIKQEYGDHLSRSAYLALLHRHTDVPECFFSFSRNGS